MSVTDRTDVDNNKYKMFRNYMVNELGVTRQDIEAWTKQSVANEVQKIIGGINIDELIASQVRTSTSQALMGSYTNSNTLVNAVATQLSKQLKISVKG